MVKERNRLEKILMQNEIYYATGNAGKFEEVKNYIEQYAQDIFIEQFDIDIEEIQSLDQKAIAIDKAKKAFALLNKPVLVDDGGIFFDAYPLFPGTMSKFIFQAIGFEGLFKLAQENNKAAFILNLVYTDGNIMQIFEGRCDGIIVKPTNLDTHPQLPFTAIFKPHGSDKTFAELRGTSEYVNYSFRQRALKQFIEWYKKTNQ